MIVLKKRNISNSYRTYLALTNRTMIYITSGTTFYASLKTTVRPFNDIYVIFIFVMKKHTARMLIY